MEELEEQCCRFARYGKAQRQAFRGIDGKNMMV